jgi:hypothetical protein
MTISEKTFWDMIKNCISFLNANIIFWKDTKVIKEDVDKLIETEKKLSEANKAQSENLTEGHVTLKRQQLNDLAKPVYRITRKLSHLARKASNPVLLKTVNYSESSLTSGEEVEIATRFRIILDAAQANLAGLEKYNFKASDLVELEEKYTTLTSIPETITVVSGIHKSATRNIKDIIADARLIFEDLDDVLEGTVTDEIFIDGWFDARKIKGRHSGGKKGNGTTPDDVTSAK